ncbi:acetate kinase [Pricia sp. S334]|uniref:Acetate kinase n=1 Tax=Pricia mediterranea TaxID=3076079 RepID=A0ABU3L132_9FLAO|nr:acetate kinase [Pricia sp. S334]MDT7827434.1 acetate kinase [Pricia sp. S334]
MKILIINAGSSSIKFQLMQMPSEKVICSGLVERIGAPNALIIYRSDSAQIKEQEAIATHSEALQRIAGLLLDPVKGAITNTDEIDTIGHRVVHGGDSYAETVVVTEKVKEEIQEFSALAPLHNPHNLKGIQIAEMLFPNAKQVAVFDTAFHQSMPVKARKYALPNSYFTENKIKVYGFHGTSHKYVSEKAIAYLKRESPKIISIHLGNGCSMTAVIDGKSVDHSMGFAPTTGLIMGTRSGDIDPSIIFHLINRLGYTSEEVNILLNKKSGMLGLTGFTDLRDIQAGAEKGDATCLLALDMNAYRIKKYIGAYAAAMNGLDAVVFTAGIGENSTMLRKLICTDMEYFGLQLDDVKNDKRSDILREISTVDSKVKVLVIPTNEELEIAKQVYGLTD